MPESSSKRAQVFKEPLNKSDFVGLGGVPQLHYFPHDWGRMGVDQRFLISSITIDVIVTIKYYVSFTVMYGITLLQSLH